MYYLCLKDVESLKKIYTMLSADCLSTRPWYKKLFFPSTLIKAILSDDIDLNKKIPWYKKLFLRFKLLSEIKDLLNLVKKLPSIKEIPRINTQDENVVDIPMNEGYPLFLIERLLNVRDTLSNSSLSTRIFQWLFPESFQYLKSDFPALKCIDTLKIYRCYIPIEDMSEAAQRIFEQPNPSWLYETVNNLVQAKLLNSVDVESAHHNPAIYTELMELYKNDFIVAIKDLLTLKEPKAYVNALIQLKNHRLQNSEKLNSNERYKLLDLFKVMEQIGFPVRAIPTEAIFLHPGEFKSFLIGISSEVFLNTNLNISPELSKTYLDVINNLKKLTESCIPFWIWEELMNPKFQEIVQQLQSLSNNQPKHLSNLETKSSTHTEDFHTPKEVFSPSKDSLSSSPGKLLDSPQKKHSIGQGLTIFNYNMKDSARKEGEIFIADAYLNSSTLS